MNIMYLLVPISVFLVFLIGLIFWWALNNHQFDALDDAASRILEDTETLTHQSVNAAADNTK